MWLLASVLESTHKAQKALYNVSVAENKFLQFPFSLSSVCVCVCVYIYIICW